MTNVSDGFRIDKLLLQSIVGVTDHLIIGNFNIYPFLTPNHSDMERKSLARRVAVEETTASFFNAQTRSLSAARTYIAKNSLNYTLFTHQKFANLPQYRKVHVMGTLRFFAETRRRPIFVNKVDSLSLSSLPTLKKKRNQKSITKMISKHC